MGESIKKIVISAINFTEGGPLTVLNECLFYLSNLALENKQIKIIALVYDKELCHIPNIDYIEIKKGKESWLKRIYIEYIYFNRLSKKIKPYLWFSLHDITPNIIANKRVVYCHNPSPFYKTSLKDLKYGYKYFLFSLFYKHLYRINIQKNDFVIVQQKWLRDEFVKTFKLHSKKVIVAYPKNDSVKLVKKSKSVNSSSDRTTTTFFYPSLSRPFKNFEIICKAVEILKNNGTENFEVILTINGNEDNYAKWIFKKFSYLSNIRFVGKISYEKVIKLYSEVSCLIFPSRLETWGLPITEFSTYNKPMIIADLPYAKETASSANHVLFFDPYNDQELANIMGNLIKGNTSHFTQCPTNKIDPPFTQSWEEVFNVIL